MFHLKEHSLKMDISLRAKTKKLLEENIGEKLHAIRFGKHFLGVTAKSQVTKEKINWTMSKLKPSLKGHYQQSEKANAIPE